MLHSDQINVNGIFRKSPLLSIVKFGINKCNETGNKKELTKGVKICKVGKRVKGK